VCVAGSDESKKLTCTVRNDPDPALKTAASGAPVAHAAKFAALAVVAAVVLA
jgi:hypothetical protein